jgi:DNA-binding MarR family transcriptional regulator
MTDTPTRLSGRQRYELAVRVALAWREIRRGASTGPLRNFLYGIEDEAIEQGQMDTLDLLAVRPSWRMSDLAEALKVEPSTATRAVQRLVKAGLAQRGPSAVDGRVVEVAITDAGRAVHREVAERRMELFRHIMSSFDPTELPVLAEMLERFVRSVDEFVATHPRHP